MGLYKYLHQDRIDVLESGLIRFSPSQALNDPFDLKPNVEGYAPKDYFKKQFREAFPKVIEEQYQQLTEQQRAAVPLEALMRHLESEVSRIEEESYQKAELLAPSLRNLLERAFEEHIGILCLTEVPDHVLMWAHYTDSHHGFLLEFDHTDAFFNQRKSTDDELRHLRRVSYSDKRPTLSLTEIGSFDVFLTKSKHWDYEQEWRMLVHLKDATKVVGGSLQPIHLFAFPKHAIKSVVLGSRMSADDKERIRGILSADREYSHVILRQAHEDKREYRINIEPPFARA